MLVPQYKHKVVDVVKVKVFEKSLLKSVCRDERERGKEGQGGGMGSE